MKRFLVSLLGIGMTLCVLAAGLSTATALTADVMQAVMGLGVTFVAAAAAGAAVPLLNYMEKKLLR